MQRSSRRAPSSTSVRRGTPPLAHQRTRGVPLYHFTCVDGHAGISQTGLILPNTHALMRHLGPLVWLTDLASPSPESVGLTADWITCDRLAYRYLVHTRAATPWAALRGRVSPAVVETLESYGDPSHWWVTRRPLLSSEFALDHTFTKERLP